MLLVIFVIVVSSLLSTLHFTKLTGVSHCC